MIFISYSWNKTKPDNNVLNLVAQLRSNGYDAICDVMLMQKESSIHFVQMMADCISKAEKVIIVLSESYKKKADSFKGGVGTEYRYIINDISSKSKKYILVTYNRDLIKVIPDFFGRKTGTYH